MRTGARIGTILVALAPVATPAIAASRADDSFFTLGASTEPPRGFIEMCATDSHFCGPSAQAPAGDGNLVTAAIADRGTPAERRRDPAGPAFAPVCGDAGDHGAGDSGARLSETPGIACGTARPVAEPNLIALLKQVNQHVNAVVTQKSDREIYGRDEVWRRSGGSRGSRGDCEDLAIEKRYELIDQGFPADRLFFAVAFARGVGLHTVLVARTASADWVLDSRSARLLRWRAAPYVWVSIQSPSDPMDWRIPA